MKNGEARGLDSDQRRTGVRKLRSQTGWAASLLARTTYARRTGVACALWASAGWAQQPPPTNPAPAAPDTAAPTGAAPAPEQAAPPAAPSTPPSAAAPGTEPPAVPGADALDDSSLDPGAPAAPLPGTPAAKGGAGANGGLEEVVVTVDRRQKNLQEYSGTAAAFSQTQLENVGVTNVQNLSQEVPGLQIGVNDQGSSTVYIRGIGSDNTTELGDPSVAVHIDNVYLPRVRGMNAAFLDVQRVEVNSGPQGTLRGRNATGGSINIVSNPAVLGEYQGSAEMTLGTYRRREFQGMLNIPLGDHLALRVAGSSSSIDPTWVNDGPLDYLPGAQSTDDYAMKGQLRFKPNSKLDMVLAGDYTLQRGLPYLGANMANLVTFRSQNNTPDDLSDDTYAPIDPNSVKNPRRVYQRGRYPQASLEHWGVRYDGNYDAGPMTFELLGSYRWQNWNLHGGSTAGFFVDQNAYQIPNQQWDNWSFAQQQNNNSGSYVGEFRIASHENQRLVWSVGLFGFHEKQGAFLGQVTGDPGGFNEFNMPSTIGSSYAAYADATFKVTDAWRLIAGIRFTSEHKSRLGGLWMIGSGLPTNGLSLCAAQDPQGNCITTQLANAGIGRFGTEGFEFQGLDRKNYNVPNSSATKEEKVNFFLDGIKSFGARDQIAISLCNDPPSIPQVQADGTTVNIVGGANRLTRDVSPTNPNGNFRCAYGIRDSVPNNFTDARPQNGVRDDKYIDFRIGTEYDLAKENMLYATLGSGHKSGGFNDSLPDPDHQDQYLTPGYGTEKAYSLEIGSKNMLLDRKLRLNASAFAYLYEGLQFQTIISVGQAPPLDQFGNVLTDPNTGLPYPDNRGGAAVRQNAKNNAHIYGLDLDANYALPAGLQVDGHALFMDARFPNGTYVNDDRLGLGSAPAQVDIGGNWLPRVAPFIFNYTLSQMIFTDAGSFDWIVQGQTHGPMFFTAFNGDGTKFQKRGPGWGVDPITGNPAPIEADTTQCVQSTMSACQQYGVIKSDLARLDDRQKTYTTFNLGLGWKRPDNMMSVRLFVNNVFNTTYATNIISQGTNNIRFYNDPRMVGVRVRFDL